MEFPDELKYRPDHGWRCMEGHEATAGITAFAAKEPADIIYMTPQKSFTYLKSSGHD